MPISHPDFRTRETVNLLEDESLPAAGRQLVESALEPPQFVSRNYRALRAPEESIAVPSASTSAIASNGTTCSRRTRCISRFRAVVNKNAFGESGMFWRAASYIPERKCPGAGQKCRFCCANCVVKIASALPPTAKPRVRTKRQPRAQLSLPPKYVGPHDQNPVPLFCSSPATILSFKGLVLHPTSGDSRAEEKK